ncbi:MAG: hypothetical protein WC135_02755 [Bacteroidales bacterium]
MKYCVLVQISKNTVFFWYQLQGTPFEPLAQKEGNELPLYFYAKGNEFIIGSFAKDRYLNGNISAFGNYFSIITDPTKFFSLYGNQKPIKYLLYYAVEQYLSFFINSVIYETGTIEEYRGSLPLRFIFSSDIEHKEKILVENLFKESGYDNVESISYSEFSLTFLKENKIINGEKPVLLLTGINGDLYIELFKDNYISPTSQEVLEGHGEDPRTKIMAKLIYDDAIAFTRLSLNERIEIDHLMPYAKQFLDQDIAIPKGDVTLSDGSTCYVKIKLKELNDLLVYYAGEDKIFKSIDTLLSKNGLNANQVQYLLNGESINTKYFSDRLKKKYNNVIRVPDNAHNETLKASFKSIEDSGYCLTTSTNDINSQKPEIKKPPLPPCCQSNDKKGIPVKPKVPEIKKVSSPPIPPPLKKPTETKQQTISSKPKLPPLPPPFPSKITNK